jgi:hypothetical protein
MSGNLQVFGECARCVFLQENVAFSPAARGVAGVGMRISGKMKGRGA